MQSNTKKRIQQDVNILLKIECTDTKKISKIKLNKIYIHNRG